MLHAHLAPGPVLPFCFSSCWVPSWFSAATVCVCLQRHEELLVQSQPHRHQEALLSLPTPYARIYSMWQPPVCSGSSMSPEPKYEGGPKPSPLQSSSHLPNKIPLLLWSRNLPQIKLSAWRGLTFEISARGFFYFDTLFP